jgi:hypothetical protein
MIALRDQTGKPEKNDATACQTGGLMHTDL